MGTIKGVKGFDKDLKCSGFQYEIGKEYETNEKPIRCTSHGFHFCENPLDVFDYYNPTSRFCEVEGGGDVSRDDYGTKIAVSKIKIGAEITLKKMVDLAVKFIFEKVNWKNEAATNTGDSSAATNTGYSSAATNTGYRSAATNTGYSSAATNTGYRSAATNTGYRSAATNTGDSSAATNTGDSSAATNTGNMSAAITIGYSSAAKVEGKSSIACGFGVKNRASGKLGCWLVLSEFVQLKGYWVLKCVKSFKVDGKKILPEIEYELINGKAVKSNV
jgi:hypothetical protein